MGTIVVGVDGSPGSDGAVHWALDEARLRGSKLRVVHAYGLRQVALTEAGVGAAGLPAPAVITQDDTEQARSEAEQRARGLAESALQSVGGEAATGRTSTWPSSPTPRRRR